MKISSPPSIPNAACEHWPLCGVLVGICWRSPHLQLLPRLTQWSVRRERASQIALIVSSIIYDSRGEASILISAWSPWAGMVLIFPSQDDNTFFNLKMCSSEEMKEEGCLHVCPLKRCSVNTCWLLINNVNVCGRWKGDGYNASSPDICRIWGLRMQVPLGPVSSWPSCQPQVFLLAFCLRPILAHQPFLELCTVAVLPLVLEDLGRVRASNCVVLGLGLRVHCCQSVGPQRALRTTRD